MKIHLTFDIEIWCNSWKTLDQDFPKSYSRYIFGRSSQGDFALPKTLDILNKNNLCGIFFVEPLFSKRFGFEFLEKIIRLIRDAQQDIQIHIHPEWTNEITPPILKNSTKKRQFLSYYTEEEQSELIGIGKKLLEDAGSGSITAFRAGGFGADLNTFSALQNNNITIDSSLNACHAVCAPELKKQRSFSTPFKVGQVYTHPVSIFRDGLGKLRPAQIGACSGKEMVQAIQASMQQGYEEFVILSHNFEMLKVDNAIPDPVVVRRFEYLCRCLNEHRETMPTACFPKEIALSEKDLDVPQVSFGTSAGRVIEQALRRII